MGIGSTLCEVVVIIFGGTPVKFRVISEKMDDYNDLFSFIDKLPNKK